jgi:hypothetical protein
LKHDIDPGFNRMSPGALIRTAQLPPRILPPRKPLERLRKTIRR